MIKRNQYVKIIFKNSIQIEGLIVSINNYEIILKNQNSHYVVKDINEILFIKIENDVVNEKNQVLNQENNQSEIERKFEEVKQIPISQNRLNQLAKLKSDMNEQEREKFFSMLKNPKINSLSTAKYEYPNFFKKPSSE